MDWNAQWPLPVGKEILLNKIIRRQSLKCLCSSGPPSISAALLIEWISLLGRISPHWPIYEISPTKMPTFKLGSHTLWFRNCGVAQTRNKDTHADKLSRHAGPVTDEGCVDKAKIFQEQAKEAFGAKQNPGTCSSRSQFLLNNEGAMYKRQRNGKHQLILPEILVQVVIRESQIQSI